MRRITIHSAIIFSFFSMCFFFFENVHAERYIRLATTTSTDNSGLLDYLLPHFEKSYGINVLVVAVGTGQAIRMGRDGDVDILLVHDRSAEEEFILSGFGISRDEIMYNDFVIIGPGSDPASISGLTSVREALKKIYDRKVSFVSRGDDSGTHKAERRLWSLILGYKPWENNVRSWYMEVGSGMGQTLNITVGLNAYTISDRGTWISFNNKAEHKVLFEGDKLLHNPYSVVQINPKRHPHINSKDSKLFAEWLRSAAAKKLVHEFRVRGERLFTPMKKSN